MSESVDYREALAAQVRKQRQERGWSQEQLADRWDRSRLSVVRLEQGKIAPDLDTIASLAEVFGQSTAEFVWPIVEPKRAMEAEREAHRKVLADYTRRWRGVRERHLGALEEDEAQQVLMALSTLIAEGTRDEIAIALDMLACVVDRALVRRGEELEGSWVVPGAEWAHERRQRVVRHERVDWPSDS